MAESEGKYEREHEGEGARERADAHQEAIRRFLLFLSTQLNYSPHTVRGYETDMRTYMQYALRRKINAFAPTVHDMRGFLSDQMNAGYARKTINRRLSALRSFFRWLSAEEGVSSGAACAVQGPKIPKHLPRALSPQEIDSLFSSLESTFAPSDKAGGTPAVKANAATGAVSPDSVLSVSNALLLRDAAIFEFLYATGARVSEAVGLTLPAIDFSLGQAKLMGKGSK